MKDSRINILYVDDEVDNLFSFKANFRNEYKVFVATSANEGLEVLRNNIIHVLISDQRMPEMTGTKFLIEAKTLYPKSIRILLTAHCEVDVLKEAINCANIFKCINKPFVIEEISEVINDAYGIYQYREEGKEIIDKLIKANEKFTSIIADKQLLAKLILASYYNQN